MAVRDSWGAFKEKISGVLCKMLARARGPVERGMEGSQVWILKVLWDGFSGRRCGEGGVEEGWCYEVGVA